MMRLSKWYKYPKEFLKQFQVDFYYLFKNGTWWIIGEFLISLLSFLTLIAFSKVFTKESFGVFQYVISTTSLIAITCLPGMRKAVVNAVARGKEHVLLCASKTVLKWSVIGVFILLSLSGWYFVQGNLALGVSFLISALLFYWPRVFNLSFDFWQGKEKFAFERKSYILVNFLEAILLIPCIVFVKNLIIVILIYFISRAIFRGCFFIFTLTKNRSISPMKCKEVSQFLSFGKHLTLINLFASISNQIDKILMWHFGGSIDLAVYSLAKIPIQKIQDAIPINPLALPRFSKANIYATKKSISLKALCLGFGGIILTLGLITIAPKFYNVIFPNYSSSVRYFQVLCLSFLFLPTSFLNVALISHMRKNELYWISISKNLLKIILLIALVPVYQIWGAIIAILASQFLESIFVLYFFFRLTPSQ